MANDKITVHAIVNAEKQCFGITTLYPNILQNGISPTQAGIVPQLVMT
jgi:hypothetical protein